jgi:RNA polymerase sigma factor (sigma-70 family)
MVQGEIHIDQYLINGLADNDSKIINEIYKKYAPKIYNWIKQNSGDQEQAEDVFQEAIIDIYRKSTQSDFKLTCPFDAFLFVIVRNKWFTLLKNNKKLPVTNNDELEYSLSEPVQQSSNEVLQYERQHTLLLQKLNQLNEGCQEVLKLSWKGLGMEEVAEKLAVTYGYVRKKKSLCLAKLVELIKNSPEYNTLSFVK